MPQISHRAEILPASPIRKLVPYADAARQRGTHVYHLNIGQPDIETPQTFWDAIRNVDMKVVAYSHSAGNLGLRKGIAKYYNRIGHDIASDDVLVTTGASEALQFILGATLNPGDEIIVPEPFYANYLGFAGLIDAKVVPLTTRIEDSFALPDAEAFKQLITPRTRAILICNPGNPTGIIYPQETLELLRDIVLEHDLFLISDEVYREFAYDGYVHRSVLGLEGLEDHAIVTDSISKRFSACGARIGAVITRNQTLMGAILKMAQARLSPPGLGQLGAEALYQLPPTYFDSIAAEYSARRDLLLERLRAIPGVTVPRVNGAFYAMVQLPVDDTDEFCRWMLESFSYKGATVMMAPGAGFYATPGLGKNEVRVAYVLNQQDLYEAMECLGEGIIAYQKMKSLAQHAAGQPT